MSRPVVWPQSRASPWPSAESLAAIVELGVVVVVDTECVVTYDVVLNVVVLLVDVGDESWSSRSLHTIATPSRLLSNGSVSTILSFRRQLHPSKITAGGVNPA